jgi:putative oxidoreductase
MFLWSGAQHLLNWDDLVEAISSKLPLLGPWVVEHGQVVSLVLAIGATVLLFAGGLMVALGLRARIGTFLLMVFLIPTTMLFHDWWSLDPADPVYREQAIQFLKNVAILGGLLMVLAFGGGKIGADGLFRRDQDRSK